LGRKMACDVRRGLQHQGLRRDVRGLADGFGRRDLGPARNLEAAGYARRGGLRELKRSRPLERGYEAGTSGHVHAGSSGGQRRRRGVLVGAARKDGTR